MFLYHILDICPKLLFFTICSSQPVFSLENSWQLILAIGTKELAFGYLYKNVTMTCSSKKMIWTLFSRPNRCLSLSEEVSVRWGEAGYQYKNSKEDLVSGKYRKENVFDLHFLGLLIAF